MVETDRPKRRLPQYFLVKHEPNGGVSWIDRRTIDGERTTYGFTSLELAQWVLNASGASRLGCEPTRFDYLHLAGFMRGLLEDGVEVLLIDAPTTSDGAGRLSNYGVRIEEALECMAMLAGEDGAFDEDLVLDLACDLYHFELQAEPGAAD